MQLGLCITILGWDACTGWQVYPLTLIHITNILCCAMQGTWALENITCAQAIQLMMVGFNPSNQNARNLLRKAFTADIEAAFLAAGLGGKVAATVDNSTSSTGCVDIKVSSVQLSD